MNYVGEKLNNHTNPTQLNITYPSITKNTLQHNYKDTNNLKTYDNKNHDKHTNGSITIISSQIYSWILNMYLIITIHFQVTLNNEIFKPIRLFL